MTRAATDLTYEPQTRAEGTGDWAGGMASGFGLVLAILAAYLLFRLVKSCFPRARGQGDGSLTLNLLERGTSLSSAGTHETNV